MCKPIGMGQRRPFGRAVCPANEGIETESGLSFDALLPPSYCRAVCPANEGIETIGQTSGRYVWQQPGRAVCPANEGIETWRFLSTPIMLEGFLVARSAPLMRGLKRQLSSRKSTTECVTCRAVCPANEGIETDQIAEGDCGYSSSRGLPR